MLGLLRDVGFAQQSAPNKIPVGCKIPVLVALQSDSTFYAMSIAIPMHDRPS